MPWAEVSGGGRAGRAKKRVLKDGTFVRILELSPEWNEKKWCKKAHIGYVLSGELRLDLSSKKIQVKEGQGFSTPKGLAHKASCRHTTKLFIVG
jgi:quercetin dioxygenase-like cupin family protein